MEQQVNIPQASHRDYKILLGNAFMEIQSIVLSNLIDGNEEDTLFIGDVLIGALNILNGNDNDYVHEI